MTTLDYDAPITLADGVSWVGFSDSESGLHCNPYLIVDGDEAVVIDGGSRPDFPLVMTKILQTGTDPGIIKALIFQHYDPDLCGSIPNFEDIIDRPDLKIIAPSDNHMFISHYQTRSEMVAAEKGEALYRFASGRTLRFTMTPYCHSPGSMVTFDEGSGILFTSDLFGSFGHEWQLFLDLRPQCRACADYADCPENRPYCPVLDVVDFHRKIMPSARALRYGLEQIAKVPFSMIAPQHGSVIRRPEDLTVVFEALYHEDAIGIDGVSEALCVKNGDIPKWVRSRLDPV